MEPILMFLSGAGPYLAMGLEIIAFLYLAFFSPPASSKERFPTRRELSAVLCLVGLGSAALALLPTGGFRTLAEFTLLFLPGLVAGTAGRRPLLYGNVCIVSWLCLGIAFAINAGGDIGYSLRGGFVWNVVMLLPCVFLTVVWHVRQRRHAAHFTATVLRQRPITPHEETPTIAILSRSDASTRIQNQEQDLELMASRQR